MIRALVDLVAPEELPPILIVDDSPTIRKVVSAALQHRGYETREASDGKVALAELEQRPVGLILLDFVMPNMNGLQFCRELRKNEKFSKIPVVLMSAKSERIRDRFVAQTGALDALEKPFDMHALLAVVEQSLLRANGPLPEARPSSDTFDELEITSTDHEQTGAPTTARMRVAGLLAVKLAERLGPIFDIPEDELVAKISERIPGPVARELMLQVREAEAGVILSGSLPEIPIPTILQMIHAESLTTQLHMTRDGVEVVASIREGVVDLVSATGLQEEYRLGAFAQEEGAISKEDLDSLVIRFQGISAADRSPFGEFLMREGGVTGDALIRALTRQSTELLHEVLRWKSGRFELRRDRASKLSKKARLGMSIPGLVLEGMRRMNEWRHIESAIGHFDTVLERKTGAQSHLHELQEEERVVFEAIDGSRSVREIVKKSQLRMFDACRMVAQFLAAGLVEKKQL